MPDYINRSELLKQYNLECDTSQKRYIALVNAPAADVELVRHGHWQTTDAYPHWMCCSECHVKFVPNIEWIGRYNIPTNYCPNCGACMDGEEQI